MKKVRDFEVPVSDYPERNTARTSWDAVPENLERQQTDQVIMGGYKVLLQT